MATYGFEQHEIRIIVVNLHGNMGVCGRPFCVTFSRARACVCACVRACVRVCVKTPANSPIPRSRRPPNI